MQAAALPSSRVVAARKIGIDFGMKSIQAIAAAANRFTTPAMRFNSQLGGVAGVSVRAYQSIRSGALHQHPSTASSCYSRWRRKNYRDNNGTQLTTWNCVYTCTANTRDCCPLRPCKESHLLRKVPSPSNDGAFKSSQSSKHRFLHKPIDIRTPSSSKGETCCEKSTMEVILPHMYHDSSFLHVSLLEQENEGSKNAYALVMLNYHMPLLTLFLWSRACARVCADGGANQIYDCVPSLLPCEDPVKVRERYKPDVIVGDLDSIRPEVKDFYIGIGTKFLEDSQDQDTTDLHKCISYIKDMIPNIEEGNVKLLVLGALGGRLDHVFANINSVYLFPKVRIVLLSDENMAFLLPRNSRHEIFVDSSFEGPHCGLLPLRGPSISTTTTGLKWNLDKTPMEFGGLISTSNIQVNDKVTVHSDTDLVWTISLQRLNYHMQQILDSAHKRANKNP